MPRVKDKAGNVVAELPYTAQGEKIAENIANKTPNLNVDYGESNTHDARSMKNTYHLGGEVPGNSRFGQNPTGNTTEGIFPNLDPDPLPPNPTMVGQNPLVPNPLSPGDTTMQTRVPKPIAPIYKEGGVVDKYYKKGGSVMTSGERQYEEYKKEKKRKGAKRDLEKSGYGGLTKREKIKLAKKKKRADAGKASREHFGLSKIKKRMKAKKVARQEKRARIKAIKEGKETSASKLEMARFKLGKKK